MFRKIATIAAASSLVVASTAAQASSASALSLRNAPAYGTAATSRAATPAKAESKLVPGGPLFFILGVIGVVAILEVTGAINIFDGDDEPDSP